MHDPQHGVARRTVLKAAAWSAPVVAVAVATPLASASAVPASLTFEVAPLVDVYAPYGSQSIRVTNTSGAAFTGPLVLTTAAWTSVAPFTIDGATLGAEGGSHVWTLPSVTIPAGESLTFDLTWTGPFPLSAEQQSLAVTTDAERGTITPAGGVTIDSPYQYLWFGVTPGGEDNPAGTESFFIGNTTETAFDSAVDVRTSTWSFPYVVVVPFTVDGTRYDGARIAEDGQFRGIYVDVPASVSARDGMLPFIFNWSIGVQGSTGQQSRPMVSIVPDGGSPLPSLGDLTVHTSYRP